MRHDRFFAILIAAAMMLFPLGMQRAFAATPMTSGHHGQSMTADHCGDQPRSHDSEKAGDRCCIAMCMAIAAEATAAVSPLLASLDLRAPLQTGGKSHLARLPTPPPRNP